MYNAGRLMSRHNVWLFRSERKNGIVNSLLIGHLPVNFILEESVSASVPAAFLDLVQQLRPMAMLLGVSGAALDAQELTPRVEEESGELARGLLQLAAGTHLVLDETQLEPGHFSERATRNLRALMELLEHQHISVDFGGFQTVEVPTDIAVLGLSRGSKSVLPFGWRMAVEGVHLLPAFSPEDIRSWRAYLGAARECAVSIPGEVAARLEADYVARRQKGGAACSFDENQLAMVLNLAKLLSKTHLCEELTWECWEEALAIHAVCSAR
jgi:hypothetical protein